MNKGGSCLAHSIICTALNTRTVFANSVKRTVFANNVKQIIPFSVFISEDLMVYGVATQHDYQASQTEHLLWQPFQLVWTAAALDPIHTITNHHIYQS